MTRTTKADLARLLALVATEATTAGLIPATAALQFVPGNKTMGIPYTLYVLNPDGTRSHFAPADGGSVIGQSASEAARTLKVMFDTLRAVNRVNR